MDNSAFLKNQAPPAPLRGLHPLAALPALRAAAIPPMMPVSACSQPPKGCCQQPTDLSASGAGLAKRELNLAKVSYLCNCAVALALVHAVQPAEFLQLIAQNRDLLAQVADLMV